jgi:hypothetical protein
MKTKCALVLPLAMACSRHPWTTDTLDAAEPDAPQTIACITVTKCTLACDTPSTFTTTSCQKHVAPSLCTSTSDESSAYGCELSCDHEARVVDDCADESTAP